jgi:hypothetical protein
MKRDSDLVKVFSGDEMTVTLLKAELEELGIPVMVRNDFRSGLAAGFVMQSPVEVYLNESDIQIAEPILKEFIENN